MPYSSITPNGFIYVKSFKFKEMRSTMSPARPGRKKLFNALKKYDKIDSKFICDTRSAYFSDTF